MSKAFTDEENSTAQVVGRAPVRSARGAERPMTPAGHAALKLELEQLLTERAARARATDLGRDAALAELDHRRRLLEATLSDVRVVPIAALDDTVRFGNTVTVRWPDGRTRRFTLVGPDEADTATNRLSVEAPLGRALLGAQKGSQVELERPRGTELVTIVELTI